MFIKLLIYILAANLPKITTIENCMKLCPMIVQALWDNKNPFLQLPHITEDMLKHFRSKKVLFLKHKTLFLFVNYVFVYVKNYNNFFKLKLQCRTLQQFAQLKSEDKKAVLRCLSDSQYDDVIKVLGHMPYIDFKVRTEGTYICFILIIIKMLCIHNLIKHT